MHKVCLILTLTGLNIVPWTKCDIEGTYNCYDTPVSIPPPVSSLDIFALELRSARSSRDTALNQHQGESVPVLDTHARVQQ